MRILIISIFLFSYSTGFAQNKEVKLATKVAYVLHGDIFSNHGVLINSPNLKIGVDFQRKNYDLYLSYNYMRQSLYRGHYLGFSFENHFLSNERRFRPYFGVSVLSEITTNYREGFLQDSTFLPTDNYILYSGSNHYKDKVYHSGFYYSTPLFGTASVGFNLRLIKDLYLSFSLGYGMQLMKYKYFKWKSYENYREILKKEPMRSRMLHYVNAELGLRYEFSFGGKL